MLITNNYGYPEPIYRAVLNNVYDNGGADISVTSLIDAPQPVELRRRHDAEISVDVSDLIPSLIGQTMHAILERSGTIGTAEERLYIKVRDWTVSGQFDYIDEDGLLWDWKTASVYEVMNGVKASRELQLNVYAHMARQNGYEVNGLRIGFLFRDWRQGDSHQSNYPPHQSLIYPISMWPEEQVVEYIDERIRLHQEAREAQDLPECTDEERWQRPGKWAVTKAGAARATKLHDTEADAVAHQHSLGNQYVVEQRNGAAVRCESYCSVSSFCKQYNKH